MSTGQEGVDFAEPKPENTNYRTSEAAAARCNFYYDKYKCALPLITAIIQHCSVQQILPLLWHSEYQLLHSMSLKLSLGSNSRTLQMIPVTTVYMTFSQWPVVTLFLSHTVHETLPYLYTNSQIFHTPSILMFGRVAFPEDIHSTFVAIKTIYRL